MSRLAFRQSSRARARRALVSVGPSMRGRRVYGSLGSVQSTYALGSVQSSYSFGDDAGEMTEAEWRKKMLEQQTGVTSWIERWVKRDELQRWLQLGATLAIPLSAAIWKAIFRASGSKSE